MQPRIFPNPQTPTAYATNVLIQVQGGAFHITFYEERIMAPGTYEETGKPESRGWVEMAKLVTGPVALRHLEEQIANAIAVYEKTTGPMPTVKEYYDKLAQAPKSLVIEQAETFLRPPKAEDN